MRQALLAATLISASCTSAPVSTAPPSIAPSPEAAISTRLVATPTPSAATHSVCRLAVTNWGWVTNGSSTRVTSQNGFIEMPSGVFTPDPTGTFTEDQATLVFGSDQTPVLHGDALATYDVAYHRWLPAPPTHVLQDGSAYVYEVELRDGSGYEIHLVHVATAADRVVLQMPYDNAYSIVGFDASGIYVNPILHRSGITGGLWLIDPNKASIQPVTNAANGTWQLIAQRAAWGGPGGQAGGTFQRLDLATGQLTTLFDHPVQGAVFEGYGYGISLLGFDRHMRPLLEVFPPNPSTSSAQSTPGPPQIWLVGGPDKATELTGVALLPDTAIGMGIEDAHGLWLVGADGVYLYTDTGFTKVAPLGPPAMPNYTIVSGCA
ncbi:MAG TPA: hypothetical protein VFR33_01945 [Candidatus Dormibacteraeota bacterium]|nr:hypothetical protein [Candidatus Dormibacteraeota bacterium]